MKEGIWLLRAVSYPYVVLKGIIMTDREKLEKILNYCKKREDFFYKPIEEGKHDPGTLASFQCQFQAASFQEIRYLVESLLEE